MVVGLSLSLSRVNDERGRGARYGYEKWTERGTRYGGGRTSRVGGSRSGQEFVVGLGQLRLGE